MVGIIYARPLGISQSKRIKRELNAPHNPPQNGVVECVNQTKKDKVCTMLSHLASPHGFGAKIVMTIAQLINQSPNRSLGRSIPLKAQSRKPFSYAHRSQAFVHVRKEEHNKLEPKSCKYIFPGYSDDNKIIGS